MHKVDLEDTNNFEISTVAPEAEKKFSFTELGNAERMVMSFANKLKFCEQTGKWYIWNGSIWQVDEVKSIEDYAKRIVKSLYAMAPDLGDEERKKLLSHIKNSEKCTSLKNMIALASSDPEIRIRIAEIDNKPHLLNCSNATVDLSGKTFRVRDLASFDMLTQSIGIVYDPIAECPLWKDFLDKIFLNDVMLIEFVQKVVGYMLSGYTGEDCLFFLYGSGANGKSTFIELLKLLFGDYYRKTSIDTITNNKSNSISNDVARLNGSRVVVCSETELNHRLAEALIKDLTGGDTISARFLYHEYFEFKPQFKLVLFGNYKPKIRGNDYGIQRRIKIIPFEYTFKDDEKRPREEILTELKNELSGILNWALEGFNKWRNEGLKDPHNVQIATQQYFAEMDIINSFIEEKCQVTNSNNGIVPSSISNKELYNAYREYCEEVGEYPLANRDFNENLGKRNFTKKRMNKGIYWIGITLKKEMDNSE